MGLARALVYRPKVLLLDEPLSNLDAKLREEMRFEIGEQVALHFPYERCSIILETGASAQ